MSATLLPLPGIGIRRSGATSGRDATQRSGPERRWHGYRSWLVTVAALVVAGCFCALVQGPLWIQSTALAAVNLAVSLVFVFTGLMLRGEAGQRGVAWALILVGIFRSIDFIDAWNGAWPVYALVFGGVDRLFGAYALLRYPNSSLLRYQRVYLVLLTGFMLVGRALIAVTSTAQWNGGPPSWWWPALIPDQRLTDALNYVVNAGEGLFGVTLMVLLVMRLVQTRGLDRIVIAPIIVAGIAAVIAASASAVTQMLVSLSATPDDAYLVESVIDLALPLAFLVAAIQRALLLRNITGLTAQISAGADVSTVRYALRSTLHDPTLDVLDLSAPGPSPVRVGDGPSDGGHGAAGVGQGAAGGSGAAGVGQETAADGHGAAGVGQGAAGGSGAAGVGQETAADGNGAAGVGGGTAPHGGASVAAAELDVPPSERLVEFIRTEAGTPIAVVIADPVLARYRGLFDAAVQTSGLALKNAQLQAQAAREKLEQVRASRARIIEAGLAERRRLERDLHDGVQQHLLSLTACLAAAMARTADPEATAAFGRARDELKEVLAELRDLAHGIHPAILSQSGLAAALEEVAEGLPLPVRVTAPVSRVGAAIEATAYLVACEALTNVVKHARAQSATVTVRIQDSQLEMEIADDGIGGITPGAPGGRGLANISDRVSALDGEVAIDSLPGQGTRLVVRIPCG
jgi:signal transduction histidine kinase